MADGSHNAVKILLMICDGLGDRPVKDLNGQTPLQHAETPNLDLLASQGVCGIMDTIGPGIRPGSDTAHLALLGYDPYKYYSGRGPFEAYGLDMEVKPGDVALRCNFGTVDEEFRIVDRRAGRIKKGTDEFTKALNEIEIGGAETIFKEGVEHRGVLILRGEDLSPAVTDTDPHEAGVLVSKASASQPEGQKTADIIDEYSKKSHDILKNHPVNKTRIGNEELPANYILMRGAGKMLKVPSINEKWGLKSAAVVGVPLVRGICKAVGMEIIDVEGATGGLDTDMIAKTKAALAALTDHDYVLLHIKACDIGGHDGDAIGKAKTIERIDKAVKLILTECESFYFALVADHSTPVSVRDHSSDPVPVAILGEGVRVDDVEKYDERACAKGGLHRIRGLDLMRILLGLANRTEMFGA
jgi:2,3-bisphosphoglycerate-independent phosphoglycerate mutase